MKFWNPQKHLDKKQTQLNYHEWKKDKKNSIKDDYSIQTGCI